MSDPKKILFVLGTRPEVIKLAPVIARTRDYPELRPVLLHTGQHRELAEEMFAVFGLQPDFNLAVMQPNQDFFQVGARILEALGKILGQERFDMIVVQGDTTTAFLGALAGYYSRTPVAHVEAGLRTRDKFHPYPEEMNRRLVGPLADLHFPPTPRARDNLLADGISPENIHVTGNTVIDALLWGLTIPHVATGDLASVLAMGGRLVLVTTHRRESFGEPHRQVFAALRDMVDRFPDLQLLFPVHPNPNVRREVGGMLGDHPRIHLTAPLGYLDFLQAMNRSELILTDSGGVQEEAPTLRKPVLVLRDQTERPEGLSSGALRLVGTNREVILAEAIRLLEDRSAYVAMTSNPNPYGDGQAANRIVEAILLFFSR
jgi:UDP-N-acetylglucosamine 2-epimerase (non-hydrolysing)